MAPEVAGRSLINRRLLADAVYDNLLADIVSGRYAPHERLNVDSIASEFGVSRTPIREGLMRLQWDRFVEIAPNSRTSVAAWGVHEMRDRLEVVVRLVTFIACDPRIPSRTLEARWREAIADHAESESGCDSQAFLALSETLVSLACNKVSAYTVRNLLRPLRLFLDAEVAPLHGVDLAAGAAGRLEILGVGLRAAGEGDRHAVGVALSRYAEGLRSALVH